MSRQEPPAAPPFVPGIELNRALYWEVVRPLLDVAFPQLPHSAALIGYGSDVLGYDTPMSTDHEWGPRLVLFLREDRSTYAPRISELLSQRLPPSFMGYSTDFGTPDVEGIRRTVQATPGAIQHHVYVDTPRSFFAQELGIDPYEPPRATDWLIVPEQRLLAVTAGAVYHDGLGELEPLRRAFSYYPHEVWLYLLCAQWTRIAQEEAFMGRSGDVGDELGSRIVAARLVRDLMKLCFLMERRYAPYSKWFGTAFSRLACAERLGPVLQDVLASGGWQERERYFSAAYTTVARMHNELGITEPLDTGIVTYHGRPYLVLFAGRFADAIRAVIRDEEVKAILEIAGQIGAIDQFVDSTDVLEYPERCRRVRAIYAPFSS